VIFFKGIPLIPLINDNVTERLRILRFGKTEFLKYLGPSDRRGQIFDRSDRSLILGGPIFRQTFRCCFVCNGFAKHVPWLLISCLTDFLCSLGSKYNGRICPCFINSNEFKKLLIYIYIIHKTYLIFFYPHSNIT
jgi:hypothetical protein